MPRPRKSDEQHKIEGTYRKDRHGAKTVKLPASRPEAPAHLSDQAKEYFNQVADQLQAMGVLTLADKFCLELIACTLEEYQELNQFIKKNGRTYKSETMSGERVYQYPQCQMLQDCSKRLASLYKEYGLTAASKGKLTIEEKEPQDDPINPFFGL